MESLEQLHVLYRRSLHEKRDDLRRVWELLGKESVAEAAVRDMHRRLHQLHGSAGAYGYDSISASAHKIERRWFVWLAQAPAERLSVALVRAELAASMTGLLDALTIAGNER